MKQAAHSSASSQRSKWTTSQIRGKSNNSFFSPTVFPIQRLKKLTYSSEKDPNGKKFNSFYRGGGTPNALIYSREKTPNGEEVKFPAVKCRGDLFCGPLGSEVSISCSNCHWGGWGHFRELWRADPQDKWSWGLLGPYPEKAMAPHSSTPGKPNGQRSLVGCSPWGRQESDTTERLHFHFSLSCIGEGNGNPLQCSCLENPRDRGAW